MTDLQKKDKKKYIFIIQTDDDKLFAGRQIDVDNAIKDYENLNEDLPFKVIGRIFEPNHGLSKDFNEKTIEWYEEKEHSPEFIKRAVNAIINLIY